MSARCFQIHAEDTVATVLVDVEPGVIAVVGAAGEVTVHARESIARGHKIALQDHPTGGAVVKFGVRIGHATRPISRGDWVHLHNLASDVDVRSASLDLHTGAPTDTVSAYV